MRAFVDTNIWVYAADGSEPEKQLLARSLLSGLRLTAVVVSTQVLSEYHVTVTRKLATPMSHDDAARSVRAMSRFEVVPVGVRLVHAAIDREQQSVLSYWDALIVEAARSAGCDVLLTEDLNAGQLVDGLEVRDPFA